MPSRYMLDTDICIYVRNRRSEPLLDRFAQLDHGDAVISAITYGELCLGAEKGRARERDLSLLAGFVEVVAVEPLPPAAGSHYASIRAELERSGTPIGGNDLWIAAHARSSGLILVTNNEREFRRVPDLRVENWAAA